MEAHFYHPIDDSLEEKAKAYSEAYKAWQNIEASFHFHDQQGWEDRLGSTEDLQTAMKITQSTLNKAIESFSMEDFHSLTEKGLISSNELKLIESHLHKNQTTNESIIELKKKEIRESRKNNAHENLKNNDSSKDI